MKKPDSVAHGKGIEKGGVRSMPKVLEHMRVHPQLGGGVRVEHHYTHFEHPPTVHEFGPQEGSKFHSHMTQHTGMAMQEEKQAEKESSDAGAAVEAEV